MVQIPSYQAREGLDAPRLARVQVEDGIGQALQRVGSAGMAAGNELGNTAAYLRAKARREQDFKAQIALDKLNTELDRDLTDAERNAPADGSGLYEGFVGKSLNPKSQAFLASIPDPEVRDEYAARLEVLRMKWENTGVDRQYALGNRYSIDQVGEMGDARARGIAENPAAVDDYVREMDEIIDLAPNTTAAQRAEMKRKFRQNAPAIVAESLEQTDMETLRYAAGRGTNQERIQFLAARLRPALTQAESSGNPNAVSPVGAVGLMQVMPATGEEIARKLSDKDYASMSHAERVAFLKNPENNVRYGTTYLEMMLERYNGDVEAALVGYNAGPRNGDRFVEAGRDYSVLPKRSETEPYVKRVLGNMGTAKLASGVARGPEAKGPEGARSGFVSSVFADMPIDDLLTLQAKVDNLTVIEQDRARIALESLKIETNRTFEDDIASISTTGKGVVPSAEMDAFEAKLAEAHGIDKVAQYREDRFVAQSVHSLAKEAGRLDDAALAARLAELSKPISGDGAAVRQRVADGARKAIEGVIAERKDDPAEAARKNFPEVAAAWAAYTPGDQASLQAALSATALAQQKMGIPGNLVNPLPKDQAERLGKVISDAARSPEERMTALVQTIAMTPDPKQQEQIIRQLVRGGLTPKVANVVDAWKRGDNGAARRLFQAAMVTPETAPRLGEADKGLDALVEDKMFAVGSVGSAFYGMDLGAPESAEIAASDRSLIISAARFAMASGMQQEDAVEQALVDVFGDVTALDQSVSGGGKVKGILDAGIDQEAFLSGLGEARGKLVDVMQGYVARSFASLPADATAQQKAAFRASMINELNNTLARGVWRNSGDQWFLYDPAHQAPVAGADNQPFTLTTQDILDLAGAAAAAQPPVSAPDMFQAPAITPAPAAPFGMPPNRPQRQGSLKVPRPADTSPVGQLKEQGRNLRTNSTLTENTLQQTIDPAMLAGLT